jgi:nucleoporin NUP82
MLSASEYPTLSLNKLDPINVAYRVLPVGRMYHAARGTSPIAEVDWHPLGEAGASLVVLTRDGKLR